MVTMAFKVSRRTGATKSETFYDEADFLLPQDVSHLENLNENDQLPRYLPTISRSTLGQ